MAKQAWGTRTGFILAAIGSAIGLGNIWRFPYMAYENGGGAFLIPYFIALLTAGIPLLILEFYIGHRMKGSAPLSFKKLGNFEWFGWWQTLLSFIISTYYAVIIAWALFYTFKGFTLGWGENTGDYFFNSFLGLTDAGSWTDSWLGGIQLNVVIPLAIVWAITYFIMIGGVRKGIERANKIFMPLLFIILLVILVRAVTLTGAADGVDALFTPSWDGLLSSSVWVSAYSQIFFTLSIGFATMITYASYLPKKSDITNNAFMIALANCGFSLLAGIAVFSALGFMANEQGIAISEVATASIGLAFVAFPQILNTMPGGEIIGVLFFLSLVFAGLSSLVSLTEPLISGLTDKFKMKRKTAIHIGIGVSALISVVYTTGSGLFIFDVVDHNIAIVSLSLSGLIMLILVAWKLNTTYAARKYINEISDFRIGHWWNFCLIVLTPAILGYNTIQVVVSDLTENYEGYPDSLIYVGWIVAAFAVVMAVYMSTFESKNSEFHTSSITTSKGTEV
ncbi:sodium-dependent transporter [Longirhabdus pacifica]|uniref:sodium-dependent transporter n=1 Tax=Longirhabdus pacifica TaxID=2305227 RepID=UPI001008C9EA|nr:sodium-dependent transporter [Longirhabdus pacifica]